MERLVQRLPYLILEQEWKSFTILIKQNGQDSCYGKVSHV